VVVAAVQLGLWHCRRTVVSIVSRRRLPVVCLPSLPATGDAAISPAIDNSSVHISAYSDSVVQVRRQCISLSALTLLVGQQERHPAHPEKGWLNGCVCLCVCIRRQCR